MASQLRKTGIEILGDTSWGTHFCHFYETKDDLLDILLPYFKAGLENNEFCIWVVFDPIKEDEAKVALRRVVPDIDRRLAAGDIEIMVHSKWYLQGGSFDMDRVITGFMEKLAQALAKGYDGMRANGNEAWLTQEDWQNFAEYEQRLNELIAGRQVIVVCTYPLALAKASDFFDVAHSHHFVIARRHGNWEVLETAELRRSKQEIEKLNTELERRIQERTAALAQAEQRYRSIFENAVEGIFQARPDGTFLAVNPALAAILRYQSPEELIAGRVNIKQIYVDANYWPGLEPILAQQRVAMGLQCEVFRKDQSRIWTIQNVRAVRDDHGALLFYEGSIQDTSERKMLEDQLRQAYKMEAIGRLTGGIAHDFNNLLTLINGYSAMLLERAAGTGEVEDELRQILTAGQKAALLTQQLLTFSRRQMFLPRVINLNRVVSEIQPMLRRLIPENIEIVVHLGPETGQVKTDPGQMDQVIFNLAANARDAMPQGGKLTIRTADVRLDEAYLRAHPGVRPGRYAMLVVTDTGFGMAETTKAHMFEPFFTTKAVGTGTGLGLAIVYGVVQQSGGHISVESEVGAGTTVRIYLPSVDEPVEKPSPVAARTSAARGQETILLVEDDDAVRTFANTVLVGLGYRVIAARDGNEAVATSANFGDRIDLLITDVIMPGMSGPEVAKRVQRERPQIKVLYMSGYVDESNATPAILDRGAFLAKPFSVEGLCQTVRDLLAEDKGAHGSADSGSEAAECGRDAAS